MLLIYLNGHPSTSEFTSWSMGTLLFPMYSKNVILGNLLGFRSPWRGLQVFYMVFAIYIWPICKALQTGKKWKKRRCASRSGWGFEPRSRVAAESPNHYAMPHPFSQETLWTRTLLHVLCLLLNFKLSSLITDIVRSRGKHFYRENMGENIRWAHPA